MDRMKFIKNRLCACGSGKKYKHCCGYRKSIYITSLIDQELIELQEEIIEFAIEEFDIEISNDFQRRMDQYSSISEEKYDSFHSIYLVWFILSERVYMGKTIFQLYLERFSDQIKRTRIKKEVKKWSDTRPFVGKIISNGIHELVVQDVFTKERMYIRLLEPLELVEGAYIYGFLLPFEKDLIFFAEPFELSWIDEIDSLLIKTVKKSQVDIQTFLLQDFLPVIYELLLIYELENIEKLTLPWDMENHRKVSLLLERTMMKEKVPTSFLKMAHFLWFKYCEKQPILTKKYETYAASIHYLTISSHPLCYVTQKEIAYHYNVSPSTIGTGIMEMKYILSEEIYILRKLYYHQIEKALAAEEEQMTYWLEEHEKWNDP